MTLIQKALLHNYLTSNTNIFNIFTNLILINNKKFLLIKGYLTNTKFNKNFEQIFKRKAI